jgi:hypothetical protein
MCVQSLARRPDAKGSGPRALHSSWWLRAHWGRAFEILGLRSSGFAGGRPGHGFVLGRKKPVSLTQDDLERPDPEDPRELEAQRQQLAVLEEEAIQISHMYEASSSWQVTRPLRAVGRMVSWVRSRLSR